MAEQLKSPPVPSRTPTGNPSGQRPPQQGVRPAQHSQHPGQQGIRPTQSTNRPPQQGVRPLQQGVRPLQQQRPIQQRPTAPQARPPQQGARPTGQRPTQQPMQQRQGIPQAQMRQQPPQQVRQVPTEENSASKYSNNFAADFNLPPSVLTSKSIFILIGVACFVGILFGAMLFGGETQKTAPQGLQGVIRNRDITTKLPRCGRTDVGQACVLYIMNHTRYDKLVESFFDDAVRLTEVQKYSIAMVNPKYAKDRIPPGHFAEIKIPNVR